MAQIKFTEEQVISDLKFIYKKYGKFTSAIIKQSNAENGTVSLNVLDRRYKTRDRLYDLIGVKNPQITFYDWCVENNKVDILDSWNYDKNICTPKDIPYSTHSKYYFKCNECGGSQEYRINSFVHMGTDLHCTYCNSFQNWCIKNNMSDLLNRWDYEKNNVLPTILPKASKTKIWLKCGRNIHESEQYLPHSIIAGLIECNCSKCKSLAQWGIDKFGDDFLDKYWDYDKNKVDPFSIFAGSRKIKVWIKCTETDYHGSYETTPVDLSSKANTVGKIVCKYCSNMNIHINDSLGFNYPKVFKIWSEKNKMTPYDYKIKSGKSVFFKCKCGKHEDTKRTISNAILNDFDCPSCIKERTESKIEEVTRLFINKELKYETLHEFNCSILPINPLTNHPLPFDNEIPKLKLIIEVHGSQHYSVNDLFSVEKGRTKEQQFEYTQWKDNFKKEYALQQGYEYIAIPYWKYKDDSYKKIIKNKINEILEEVA